MPSQTGTMATPETQDTPPGPPRSTRRLFLGLTTTVFMLVLAALSSPISQSTLAPVFGAVPSAVGHEVMIHITFAFGYFCNKRPAVQGGTNEATPVLIAWIPVIESLLITFSSSMGASSGPMLMKTFGCSLLLLASSYGIPEVLYNAGLQSTMEGYTRPKAILQATLMFMFRACEAYLSLLVPKIMATFKYLTPTHMYLLLAAGYSLLFPSWLLLFTIPAILHAQYMNPHFTSAAVDASLGPYNWTLVERQWSYTGYISVLDSFDMQYRVMRCDHSLLGGEWLLTEDRKNKEGWKVNEPIYAVFQMLEAVRLMELEPAISDAEAQALVIGLGIGTAPKALVAHGIQTTVVELDPVVHEFATKYFDLPTNHTAVIQDAVSWAKEETAAGQNKYDYILHDVFTGGTEPLSLFNTQFLGNLRSLLAPNGVIAINYAGDLALPLTGTVLNTINVVFSGQCKIFRDGPPEQHSSTNLGLDSDTNSDFLNMVVFCRNTPGPITFRKPRRPDYLGSKSRQYYMLPKPEYEIPFPSSPSSHANAGSNFVKQDPAEERSDASDSAQGHGGLGILELGDEGKFVKAQRESALRHWAIMRKVLPDAVWEFW